MEQLCKTVPNFLTKLWVLVDDAGMDHVIRWSKDGHSFEIVNEENFSKEILPKYFKHDKISSFIRQLNMYGFRKVIAPQDEKTTEKKLPLEFQHPLFKKGGVCLLENIKRKVSKIKNEDISLYSNEFQKILTEMQEIRNIQRNMDARYSQMKQDYSNLYLEITNLRKKYCEQQQLLTQVLHCILDLISGNCMGLKKRKRSLSFIPGASDSEWDHQYLHIPDDKKKEAMEIIKDGYELVEDKYKSLLDSVLPILKESKNLISSVDQPSGDDGKDPNMPVLDIPMNEDSLTIQLDLTIPFFQEQITEEWFVKDPKDFSSELEHCPLDSILIAEQSDTLCNSIMNRNEMYHTEGNLVELNSLLSRKAVNYDFDHFSESACYELPVWMANKSKNLLNVDIVVETHSVSLMENEGERSLLEDSGEKGKDVKQCLEKPQLLLLDGTPICDFGENLQDSNDLLLDILKNPSNTLPALCDHDYAAFNISATKEDTTNTIENIVPQLSAEANEEANAFPFLFLSPVTNSF